MEVGELISFYRRQCGMTIDELAEKSGVAKGTLNKITGGITKAPTLDNMKSIARALGKRLADFDDEPELAEMFSPSEQEVIKKYRALDRHGKEMVDVVLEKETDRMNDEVRAVELQAHRKQPHEEVSEEEIPEKAKKPTLVSEDGPDNLEKLFTQYAKNLMPTQKRMLLEQMQNMIGPQKESSTASAPQTVDEKDPKSEHPDQP